MTDKLMTMNDVAEYLGLSYRTIQRLVSDGKISHFRHRRIIRFRRSDVDKWISKARGAK